MRIKPRPFKEYPWYVRLLLRLQRNKYGTPLNSSQLWARSPRVFIGLSMLYGAIDRASSPISPALRSLVILRVSQLNGCEFCIDLNSSLLLRRGFTPSKLEDLTAWKTSSLYQEKEKVVLDYAEAMTLSDRNVEDRLMEKLKISFTEDEIIELTAIIAFQNMSTKFNTALDIPSQGFS